MTTPQKTFRFSLLMLLLLVPLFQGKAGAKLRVVATTEHEALIAREIGGDLVDVQWIAGADQDPLAMEPDSNFVPFLEKADLLLVNGEELEAGWLGTLLKEVKNRKMNPKGSDRVVLSEGVRLLPFSDDDFLGSRFQEILASQGIRRRVANHHYWLDPENSIPMIRNIAAAFARADGKNAAAYERTADERIARLKEKIREWDEKMVPFRGKKVILYHRNWNYLVLRHGLEIAAIIEPKEMNRPADTVFRDLAVRFKDQAISLVLLSGSERPPFVDIDRVRDLAVRIHARSVILPESMKMSDRLGDLDSYFDYVYKVLIAYLSNTP